MITVSAAKITRSGNNHRSFKLTPETKAKMSKARRGKFFGEANPNSKLADVKRREIYKRYYSNHKLTHKGLAKDYGVSANTIRSIVINDRWGDEQQ